MAVTVSAATVTPPTVSGTNPAFNLPTFTSGRLGILVTYSRAARSVTADPSGWTTVADERGGTTSGPRLKVYARLVDGTEGSTASLTLNGSAVCIGYAYEITGADLSSGLTSAFPNTGTDTPLSGAGVGENSGTGATTLTNAGFTTTVANTVLMQMLAQGGNVDAALTPATGFGNEDENYANDGTNDANLSVSYKTQASAGATGALDASSDNALAWANLVIGIAPAAGGSSLSASSTLTGTGTVTATAARSTSTSATPSGTATITSAAFVNRAAAGTLTGTGSVTAAAAVTRPATATLTGTGTVTAAATLDLAGESSLTGTATITAAATVETPSSSPEGDAALTGSAAITAAAAVDRPAQATLTAVAAVTGAAFLTRPTGSTLTATGNVTATAVLDRSTDAALAATAAITATATVSNPALYRDVDLTATVGGPRLTATVHPSSRSGALHPARLTAEAT